MGEVRWERAVANTFYLKSNEERMQVKSIKARATKER